MYGSNFVIPSFLYIYVCKCVFFEIELFTFVWSQDIYHLDFLQKQIQSMLCNH